MRRLPLLLVAAILASGCSENNLVRFDIVDVWHQNPPDEVDILMVVDDSCSMDPYQSRLGASFDIFISYFIEADVDYQIGVVTTDVIASNKSGRIQGEVITPETPSPGAVFSRIVAVGTRGAGMETGLEAARMALAEPLISTSNAGFLREDASLSVIFVSDEEDSSPDGVNSYINDLYAVKGHRNREVMNASALVVSDLGPCDNTQAQQSTVGTRYLDVALQTEGIIGNLCDDNFEEIVFELSLNSSRLRNTYYLSELPNVETLQVRFDNDVEPIPCDSGRYTYDLVFDEQTGETRPAIIFPVEFLPAVGTKIAARFFDGDGDPAKFCLPAEGGE
ncbi:MAG: hypothetical protein ACI9MC_004180 [Kiritimatiellia bacterium]|jgi:hypothetical protein